MGIFLYIGEGIALSSWFSLMRSKRTLEVPVQISIGGSIIRTYRSLSFNFKALTKSLHTNPAGAEDGPGSSLDHIEGDLHQKYELCSNSM